MSEVRVDLSFREKGESLDKIKKELQEIAKLANTQVRFGAFDTNKIREEANEKKLILSTVLQNEIDNNKKIEAERKRLAAEEAELARRVESEKQAIREKSLANLRQLQSRELAMRQEHYANVVSSFNRAMMGASFFIGAEFKQLLPLEKQVYDLAVIANKAGSDIRVLRQEILNMSKELPFSSAEIGKAINDVARTGKSVEESFAIVREAGKMAVSAGESLGGSVEIITKILTAFNLEIQGNVEVLDKLHAVAANTPLSFESLGEAMRNSASAVGLFTQLTNKSGTELTQYKKDLIELNATFAGGLSLMGRTASTSGTNIKTFTTKMIALEERAKKLFDKDTVNLYYNENEKAIVSMQEGAKATQGVYKINSDYLSKLSQQDLPMATDMLSKLTVQGKVSQQTLQKMFTIWNAPATSSVLYMMGGDLEKFNDAMTGGRTVMADYELKMEDLNNQIVIFKNIIDALGVGLLDMGRDAMRVVTFIAGGIKNLNNGFGGLTAGIMEFATMFALVKGFGTALNFGLGLEGIVKSFKEIRVIEAEIALANTAVTATEVGKAGAVATTNSLLVAQRALMFSLGIPAIIAGITMIALLIAKANREQEELIKKRKRDLEELNNIRRETALLNDTTKGFIASIDLLNTTDFTDMWVNSYALINKNIEAVDKMKELVGSISLPKISPKDLKLSDMNIRNEKEASSLSQLNDVNKQIKAVQNLIAIRKQYDSIGFYEKTRTTFSEFLDYKNIAKSFQDSYKEGFGKNINPDLAVAINFNTILNNLTNKQTELNKQLALSQKERAEANKAYYEQEAKTLQDNINAILEIGKIIDGINAENQADIIKTMFSDKSLKTVDQFSNKLNGIFGNDSGKVTGFNELISVLKETKGATDSAGNVKFELFKNEDMRKAIGQIETYRDIIKSNQEALNKYSTEEEIRSKIARATSTEEKRNLESQLAIRRGLLENIKGAQDGLKRLKGYLPYLVTQINNEEELNKKLRERILILSDVYNSAIRTRNEFKAEGSIELFSIKENNIKEQFKYARDTIINEAGNIRREAESKGIGFNLIDFRTADISQFENVKKELEANRANSQETQNKYESFMKYYNLYLEYQASLVNEGIEIDKNGKAKTQWEEKLKSVKNDISNINATELQKLESNLKLVKERVVAENDVAGMVQKTLDVLNAENAVHKERTRILNDYVTASNKVRSFGANNIQTLKMEREALILKAKNEKNEIARLTYEEEAKYKELEIGKAVQDQQNELKWLREDMSNIGETDEARALREIDKLKEKYTLESDSLEKARIKLDIEQKTYDIQKKQVSIMLSAIDSFTKGEIKTPSYDSDKATAGFTNLLTGKKVDYQHIGAMLNFAITQFNNVYQNINKAEIEKINADIETLEMRKSIARTDKEARELEQQILDKKIQAIQMEAKGQATSSMLGGVTGGISSGLQVAAAGGFNPASLIAGGVTAGMSVLGGLFGASSAKKQAEAQKRQLENQMRTNRYLEDMKKLMEANNSLIENTYSAPIKGYEKAKEDAMKQFQETKQQQGLFDISGAKDVGQFNKTKTGQAIAAALGLSREDFSKSKITQTIETTLSGLQKGVTALTFNSSTDAFKTIKDQLADFRGKVEKFYQVTSSNADDLLLQQLKDWESYVNTLEQIANKKDVFYSAYFGFDIKYIKDTAGYITEVAEGEWKKREELISKIAENTKKGVNDIQGYLGDWALSSIMSTITSNSTILKNYLDGMEAEVKSLASYMSKNQDKSIAEIFDVNNMFSGISNLIGIKDAINAISEEQNRLNSESRELVKIWTSIGGKISDAKAFMDEFQSGLYDVMLTAIKAEDSLEASKQIGQYFGDKIGTALAENLINSELQNSFNTLTTMMTDAISLTSKEGLMNFDLISRTSQEIRKSMTAVEVQRQQLQVAMDLLSYSATGDYTSENQQINYETGSTKNNVYNVYNNVQFEMGNVVANEQSMREFSDEIIGYLAESAKNKNISF